MTKAYWVATYRSVTNPDALAAYARSSAPVLAAAGARPLARGLRRMSLKPGSSSGPSCLRSTASSRR